MSEIVAVIDTDYIKYHAAAVGEKRTIIVTHNQSGNQKEFSNRTEFYGRDKSKSGGWLGELNSNRTSPFLVSDFSITDAQTPEPIENVLHTAKHMYEKVLSDLNTRRHKGFIGQGQCFRVELSTILKYKGNRDTNIKPLYVKEVEEYLIKKFNLEIVTDIENDDRCVMECFKKNDHVLCGPDKDHGAQPVLWYNPSHPEWGIQDGNCFGKLWIDDSDTVRGVGRLFLYHQICSSDDADNYAANSATTKRWGEKSSYKKLFNCQNDKEALTALKNIYQKLYPEPFEFVGWRGDTLQLDWLKVASENWNMARMKRFDGDNVQLKDVLEKLGII